MPRSCVAAGCTSRAGSNKPSGLTFFRIPVDPERRKKWIDAINRKNWTPTPSSLLCSKHFISGRPDKNPDSPDNIPTIFSYSHNISQNPEHIDSSYEAATAGSQQDMEQSPNDGLHYAIKLEVNHDNIYNQEVHNNNEELITSSNNVTFNSVISADISIDITKHEFEDCVGGLHFPEQTDCEVMKRHICEECKKKFKKISDLLRHKRIHAGEKPYICEECNKSFTQAATLKRHMLVHSDVKSYVCEECNRLFTTAANLKMHKRFHTGEKPYSCTECDKSFTQSSTLKRHILVHTGVRNHQCDKCFKSFKTSSTLNMHKRSHSEERPHVCDKCNKSFTLAGNLKQHMLLHSDIKKHVCIECDNSFSLYRDLKNHMLLHSDIKTYACNECNKLFSHAGSLKNHMIVHKKEMENRLLRLVTNNLNC